MAELRLPDDNAAVVLDVWCRAHGLDAGALFDGGDRTPQLWSHEGQWWWTVPLPDGTQVVVPVRGGEREW